MEDIDLIKKRSSLAYGSKKANRGTSMFAYRKMSEFLKGKAFQRGIGVITINPAYTSFIAKVKYLKHWRSPIHMAASYVIGRRAMGFMERMPGIYKNLIPPEKRRSHHWKQFSHLYNLGKGIPPRYFKKALPEMMTYGQYKTILRVA